jgi:dihydroorotate dehydrogenase
VSFDIYRDLLRSLIFKSLEPEAAHQSVLQFLKQIAPPNGHATLLEGLRFFLQQTCHVQEPCLTQRLWNLPFPNPIGIAAGFDKNGVAVNAFASLGFGFAELGTVTFHAQPGNPQPRLFRLPQDQAILNRMGFNNDGAAALAALLKERPARLPAHLGTAIPIGINLGKSKITPLEEAVADYVGSFQLLKDLGDYFVVNVSSPNTPGLRSLQSSEQLAPILEALQTENQAHKPLLVKIAPDLEWVAIQEVVDLAQRYQLAGIIATNTTINREGLQTQILSDTQRPLAEEAGGISGMPVQQRSTDIIRFIYQQTQGQLPIIGVGGVFTAEDAWAKITAGASLVQLYTGWIYEGPWMVKRILQGLVQKLEEHQLSTISEAVGIFN